MMRRTVALSATLAMLLCNTAGAQVPPRFEELLGQAQVRPAPIYPSPPVPPVPSPEPTWTMGPRGLPPAQFDKPYSGQMTVTYADTIAEVAEFCRKEGRTILGCAKVYRAAGICEIKLAPDYLIKRQGQNPDDVLRHEIGHCNGWPGDHSDGSTSPAGWPVIYPDLRGGPDCQDNAATRFECRWMGDQRK